MMTLSISDERSEHGLNASCRKTYEYPFQAELRRLDDFSFPRYGMPFGPTVTWTSMNRFGLRRVRGATNGPIPTVSFSMGTKLSSGPDALSSFLSFARVRCVGTAWMAWFHVSPSGPRSG